MAKTPQQLIEEISTLSDEYYDVCEEAGQIAERSGTAWLEIRKGCKTNAEADQMWQTTPDGKRENFLKWYTKGLTAKRGARILELRLLQVGL